MLTQFLLLTALTVPGGALAAPPRAADGWLTDWESARKAAQASSRPVLVDFQAVWCYSCYYMEQKVLSRELFKSVARDLVLLKLDVDSPEGREWKGKLRVRALPSYLVLDSSGTELGRIAGERTETEFVMDLRRIIGEPEDKDIQKLRVLSQAQDWEAAAAARDALRSSGRGLDRDFQLWSARIDFNRALEFEKFLVAAQSAEALLDLEEGCALAYDALILEEATSGGETADALVALRAKARERLEAMVERRVFGPVVERCADLRSPLEALANLYGEGAPSPGRPSETGEGPRPSEPGGSSAAPDKEMRSGGGAGDAEKRSALLVRAIALLSAESQKAGVGKDRNLDDNLRYFLEAAGKSAELDKLYPRLIKAYPADYVYSYRYAKNLFGRKEFARALPHAQAGLRLSYGANRLQAAALKGRVLAGLKRKAEARAFLEAELNAARKRFPKDLKPLEDVLKEIIK